MVWNDGRRRRGQVQNASAAAGAYRPALEDAFPALAGVAPNARVATVMGNVLLFAMMFLSGTTLPLEVMPEGVRNASRFLPLTRGVTLLRGLWFGESLGEHLVKVAVLAGVLVGGTTMAAGTFRWE